MSDLISKDATASSHFTLERERILKNFFLDWIEFEQRAKDYPKVKGVHTNIEMICKELPIAVKQSNQDSVVVSVVSANEKASNGNRNQFEPSFMYTQIFKEILLEMEHDDKSKADLVAHRRAFYQKNEAELKIIDKFEHFDCWGPIPSSKWAFSFAICTRKFKSYTKRRFQQITEVKGWIVIVQ